MNYCAPFARRPKHLGKSDPATGGFRSSIKNNQKVSEWRKQCQRNLQLKSEQNPPPCDCCSLVTIRRVNWSAMDRNFGACARLWLAGGLGPSRSLGKDGKENRKRRCAWQRGSRDTRCGRREQKRQLGELWFPTAAGGERSL